MLFSESFIPLVLALLLGTVMASKKQASKRFCPDSSSDTSSINDSLSYLDLDTGNVVKTTSTPAGRGITLTNKAYDALMKKLNHMDTCLSKLDKLDKLDQIENSVRKMSSRIETFENRLTKNESAISSVERSASFISEQYEDIKTEREAEKVKIKVLDKKVTEAKTETDELKSALIEMKKLNSELKEEVLDLKSRSMRDNLIFRNIPEVQNENTEEVLTQFLSEKMNIENICFERVHRMWEKKSKVRTQTVQRPNLIVAKFTFFKDRERVRKAAKMLKGTNFSIQEQFPEEIEARRKPLYPLLKAARKDDKRASLVKDRLFVDGREVLAPVARADESLASAGPRTSAATRTASQR